MAVLGLKMYKTRAWKTASLEGQIELPIWYVPIKVLGCFQKGNISPSLGCPLLAQAEVSAPEMNQAGFTWCTGPSGNWDISSLTWLKTTLYMMPFYMWDMCWGSLCIQAEEKPDNVRLVTTVASIAVFLSARVSSIHQQQPLEFLEHMLLILRVKSIQKGVNYLRGEGG